ncbi:MAG: UDP-N-acetylmuramate--L-alanine ligase [Clostridia bacterium]|nr:UDP-N-acetylmuramate--L-alanine ligase [Clostridia bacterium]
MKPQTKEILDGAKSLHFAGIGGISMSTIALLALKKGYAVTGSDRNESDAVKKLIAVGIPVTIGHLPASVEGKDAVIYTAALGMDNPELAHAAELGIPLISRGEFLGYLMCDYNTRIGVSGTHGKTTTTSMIAHLFERAGYDPTVANGAILPKIGSAYRPGSNEYFVYEACEYKDSFLSFEPSIAIITNLELDHTDYFDSIEAIIASFQKAIQPSHAVVANLDSENVKKALVGYEGWVIGVSLTDENADFSPRDLHYEHGTGVYTLCKKGIPLCEIRLPVIGEFNVYNSLCASAVAITCGVEPADVAAAFPAFSGAARRFERKGVVNGIAVYDDYAHHPDEIRATLEAASKLGYGRIFCIFQPHTYSRTHDLLPQFEAAFGAADQVIFADIYAARETDTLGVSSALLAKDTGGLYLPSFEAIADYLAETAKAGDLILTMGAGDVYKVAGMVLEKIK